MLFELAAWAALLVWITVLLVVIYVVLRLLWAGVRRGLRQGRARSGGALGRARSRRRATPARFWTSGRGGAGQGRQALGRPPLGAAREFSGCVFGRVCVIEPECDRDGQPRQYLAQGGYRNVRGLRLHRYGAGPFCKFRISENLEAGGVYLLTVNGLVWYVGECQNLSLRFNTGYGHISPRNCFEGGQSTNCKVNHQVLEAAKRGQRVELWFHETANRHAVEARLVADLAPPWNSQGKR